MLAKLVITIEYEDETEEIERLEIHGGNPEGNKAFLYSPIYSEHTLNQIVEEFNDINQPCSGE
jgi:hypothetical protein